MAGAIKGITIEFRGDTTSLDKALNNVKKEAKNTSTELKYIDKALKFNPTSVDAWKQKQIVLNKAITETKEKLNLMKQGLKEMEAQGLNAENSEEFRRMQREIDQTERYLKRLEAELKAVGNVKLRAASEQFKQWGESLDNAGQKMRGLSMAAAAVTASIGALAVKSGQWADDINTMSKRYGTSTKDLQKYSVAADLVDVSTEAIAKSQTRLKKSMLSASQGSKTQTKAFETLGVSVTNADGSLRDSEDVFNDVITSLGSMTNETERDALAMQIMGKSANELNPLIEDGGETYKNVAETLKKYNLDFIDQETLDNANKFNDEIDTIKAIGLVAFQSLGSELAGYLAPALEKVVGVVGKFAEWLSKLDPAVLTIIAGVGAFVAVLAPLLIGLGKISFAISSILGLAATIAPALGGVVAALKGAAAFMIGPWGLAIAAAVAAGVLLYKNWDKVKAFAKKLWKNVKDTFQKISDAIKDAWEKAKTITSSVLNAVTNNVKQKFNQIKNIITTVLNVLKTVIKNAWNFYKTIITTYLNAIKTIVTTVWNAIKTVVTTAVNAIKTIITTVFNLIKAFIQAELNEWKLIFTKVWDGIKTVVTTAVNAVRTTITTVFNAIKTFIQSVVNGWKTIITTAWNGIKSTVTSAVNAVKSTVSSVFNSIKSTVQSIWNAIKNAITSPINAARNTVTSVVNSIKSKVSSGFSGISSKVSSAFNAVKTAITTPIQKAWDLVKSAVDKIKGIFPIKLGKIFSGIKLPHFKISGGAAPWGVGGKGTKPTVSIEWYKKGAIFKQPTIFATNSGFKGVGEAGAEAVLPLDTLWEQMAGMGNTIVQGVTANQQRQDYLLEQLVTLNALMLEQLKADKDFRIDGRVAGRIINDLVRV